jgi:hypothetical protein
MIFSGSGKKFRIRPDPDPTPDPDPQHCLFVRFQEQTEIISSSVADPDPY